MSNPAIRYGILGGISLILYFVFLYVVDPSLFLNPWLQWGSVVLYGACMYQAALDDAKISGFGRPFREMTRTPFLTFVLMCVAYWLFYYSLHLYDKSMIVLQLDKTIAYLQAQINSGVGDPSRANDLRIQIAELEKMKANPVQPLAPVLAQMGQGFIGGFMLSALIIAVLRRPSESAPQA